MKKKRLMHLIRYLLIVALGIVIVFPLIYLLFTSFKANDEIYGSLSLLPRQWILTGYTEGWKSVGQYTFGNYLFNSFLLTVPTMLFTLISSLLVAYGFARFDFPFKKMLFIVMYGLMMLPNAVLIIPRYLIFAKLKWIDSYLPFWTPGLLATSSFFIYMFVEFFRGLPHELDESAMIDGCSSFRILVNILLPLCVPAMISAAIFSFIWTWNDFMSQYIYISSVPKYTVALGLRMAIDATASIDWANVLAMSILSIIPGTLIYLFLQKYFVEGVATSGMKG